MINGQRILAIAPARGGSKGIPLKNLRPVGGIPLVARVGHLVQKIPMIDRAVVSTDHAEIARVAESSGLTAPFWRPEALSGDRISDWDVLSHALVTMEEIDQVTYDIILMLQPTSPLRTPGTIISAIEQLVCDKLDAVWTVSETDSKAHPLKQLVLTGSDHALHYYATEGAAIIARQQLNPVYHRNGIAYVMTRACLMDQKTIMGEKTGAYVVDEPSVSIDTEWDIQLVEMQLKEKEKLYE